MALEDLLTAAVVRPVTIGFLDIRDAAVYGWDGPGAFAPTGTGDTELDDNLFLSVEGAVHISDFLEDQGIGGEIQITFAPSEDIGGWIIGEGQLGEDFLGQPQGAVFDQIVNDRRSFLGRRAVLWRGFLTEDESSVLPDIHRLFTGVMVHFSMSRQTGQPTTVTITCDQDTQKARSAPVRLVDHQFYYPSDPATTYINDLARGAIATAVVGEPLPPGPLPGHPRVPRRGVLR